MKIAQTELKKFFHYKKILSDPKRLLILLIILGIGIFYGSLNETSFKAKVVRVIDGDTIELLDTRKQKHRIRFWGIDAPETTTNQPFGKKAKEILATKIAGKEIKATIKDKDKYGRTIAKIELNGEDINKFMVASGLAWAYTYYTDAYKNDEKKAREAKIGLWVDKNPIEPYEWRKKHSKGVK